MNLILGIERLRELIGISKDWGMYKWWGKDLMQLLKIYEMTNQRPVFRSHDLIDQSSASIIVHR